MPETNQFVDKSQIAIKEQLLKCINQQPRTKDFQPDAFLQKLDEGGYCFGFALCRAAMRVSGKLAWWDAAIDAVARWDGTEDALDKIVQLPDADQAVNLRTIFERVTHYIVFNMADIVNYPLAYHPSSQYFQHNFLLPYGPFTLINKGKVLRIERNYTIAGHFTHDDLKKSLQDPITTNTFKNNICLISSPGHTCELAYHDNQWYFSDPNYPGGEEKSFANIDDLITEITRVLGQDLSITLACFNTPYPPEPYPFSYYYDELLEKNPEKLVENNGFSIIVQDSFLAPIVWDNLKQQNKNIINIIEDKSKLLYALRLAAERNQDQVITRLCHAGLDPNELNNDYLMINLAAEYGHKKAFKALLKAGADPNLVDKRGYTALIAAAEGGQADIVLMLYEQGAYTEETLQLALARAVISKDLETINVLLNIGADVNQIGKEGFRPFSIAVELGSMDIVKMLLERGANPSMPIRDGFTELTLAAYNGNSKIVKILLETKAFTNQDIQLALIKAAANGNAKTTTMLLNAGANLNQPDESDWTPLMIAALHGNMETTRTLLNAGADPSITNNMGGTALSVAAYSRHPNVIDMLCEVTTFSPEAIQFAFIMSVLRDDWETVTRLIKEGANPNQFDNHGKTPLMTAAQYGHLNTIKVLLNAGADPLLSNDGWNALMIAIEHNRRDVASHLLPYQLNNLNINLPIQFILETAAQQNCSAQVANFIQRHNINRFPDASRFTIVHFALLYGRPEIAIDMLEKIPDPTPAFLASLLEFAMATNRQNTLPTLQKRLEDARIKLATLGKKPNAYEMTLETSINQQSLFPKPNVPAKKPEKRKANDDTFRNPKRPHRNPNDRS